MSVDIYDEITVKDRKDHALLVSFDNCPMHSFPEKTNAYKVAERYIKTFGTTGAEISIKRGIPSGGGLGSSSADAAGVLIALSELYGYGKGNFNGELTSIVNDFCSDGEFMLKGGFARICGRGKVSAKLELKEKLYFLILTGETAGETVKVYREFDRLGKTFPPCTQEAIEKLQNGDKDGFCSVIKNDLFEAANSLSPVIAKNLDVIKNYGTALMTGSGSAVFALFFDKRKRDKAFEELKEKYDGKIFKAENVESF